VVAAKADDWSRIEEQNHWQSRNEVDLDIEAADFVYPNGIDGNQNSTVYGVGMMVAIKNDPQVDLVGA
jgi:hypothetical protein